MHAEFKGEIGDRHGAKHTGMGFGPDGAVGEILLESTIGVVNPAEEDELCSSHLESFGGEFAEECDGVVVELPPSDGVEIPKEVDHLGLPTPPDVAGQGHALFV